MSEDNKEKKYFIRDYESGIPYEVTKEQWEDYQAMWDYFRPKLKDSYKGQIIIFGTKGDFFSEDNYSSLFYSSNIPINPFIPEVLTKYFIPSNKNYMPIFTPGQREEAIDWIRNNCPNLEELVHPLDHIIDMYFKLKNVSFTLKPHEFIVGIEYKNMDNVIKGKEPINIAILNIHKKGEYDESAHAMLVECLNRLKS